MLGAKKKITKKKAKKKIVKKKSKKKAGKKKKLTSKQLLFAHEYMIDLNATQAAIRAGYSEKTSYSIGNENLNKPEIAEFIAKLMENRTEATKVDAQWVLERAVEVHERCMQHEEIKDHEGVGTGEYKFEHSGANKSLEIIGKHVDVQAFKDRVEHSGYIDLSGKSEQELKDIVSGKSTA